MEKVKLRPGQICNYCGSPDNLSLDHIFPKKHGGGEQGDNLVYACRECNSSKGKKDLMEWMAYRGTFLPLMIIRRYLKLTFAQCLSQDLLNLKVSALADMELAFKIALLPTSFPKPGELVLNIEAQQRQ